MIYLPLVAEEWLPIAGAVIFGTLLTIAATAWVMSVLLRRSAEPGERPKK